MRCLPMIVPICQCICVYICLVCVCGAKPLFTFLHHTSVCVYVCACARWNQLDLAIVLLSVMGIILEEIEISAALPINPTIIRIMRVLRIARGTYTTCVKYTHTLKSYPSRTYCKSFK